MWILDRRLAHGSFRATGIALARSHPRVGGAALCIILKNCQHAATALRPRSSHLCSFTVLVGPVFCIFCLTVEPVSQGVSTAYEKGPGICRSSPL